MEDSARAFDLVRALQDQVNQLLNERSMNAIERKGWEQVKISLDAGIAINASLADAYKALDAVKDKIIKIQSDMIDKLNTQLMKKKSFFDKVLDILKEATILLAGYALGHV